MHFLYNFLVATENQKVSNKKKNPSVMHDDALLVIFTKKT